MENKTALDERLIKIRPHTRQIEIQNLGFYAFFHFTINTFTGKEWGDGTEDPSIFNPTEMDAEQWVRAVSSAGMKGAILTCKHHDGFCLWPSKYTGHSIASSPYRGGAGDIVQEVSWACKKYGLKFGVYLSPWDRNHRTYGQGKAYDDYFVNQLTELLTQYGDIFCVWFDGACGEGAGGRRQNYDWKRYYETVRKYQPKACISVTGPDVRWCGNEAGSTRKSEWSVVSAAMSMEERIAAASQHADDPSFRERVVSSMEEDLGSRGCLEKEENLIWYPAEVDVSIRPGWFYHREEDDQVRSLENLLDIYEKSVGGNATLLLNIPPMPNGRLNDRDVQRLKELGERISVKYGNDLAASGKLYVKEQGRIWEAEQLREDSYEAFYEGMGSQLEAGVVWNTPQKVSSVILKEDIRYSQRIENFEVFADQDGSLCRVYAGTTVGFRKIIPIKPTVTRRIIIRINDSRVAPVLSYLGVYGGIG